MRSKKLRFPFVWCYTEIIIKRKAGDLMVYRTERNITPYFDKMGPDDIRILHGTMNDMKYYVESLERLFKGEVSGLSEQEISDAIHLKKYDVRKYAKNSDEFVKALGLESLFGTEEVTEYTDEVFIGIIERYRFLMAKKEEG